MDLTRRKLAAALLPALAPTLALAQAAPPVPPADLERRIPVKGGSLYARVNGDLRGKKPPILMVHGGPGGALWQFFPALPLASDRAVILYDQLDSGRSDAPGVQANWTVERYVSEIEAVRRAFGLERFHLLGHSWGGILATRYAALAPKGLESLILQGTPLSDARLAASVKSLYAALPDGAGAVIDAAERAGNFDDPAFAKAMGVFMRRHLARTGTRAVAMPYMEPTPPDRGDALAMAMTGGKLAGFDGVLKGFDDEPLLARIEVPTLLLYGAFDILTPDAIRAMAAKLKRASVREIADSGHMAQFDQPGRWRAAVSDFVSENDAQWAAAPTTISTATTSPAVTPVFFRTAAFRGRK